MRARLALLAVALVPSAWVAWEWRAMPHLGFYHDDAIYLVSAKSIAEGGGYRIASLPEQPYQTKYPPLWPLALALVWKVAPQFPANLPWLALLAWAMIPVCVTLVERLLRDEGFGPWESAGIAAAMAVSPAVVMPGTMLLSDLAFLALLVASLTAAGRGRFLVAGVMGGAAFLVRTAALPLLVAGPLWAARRHGWRAGVAFAAKMAPAVVAWLVWTAVHREQNPDAMTMFYTSYLAYWKADLASLSVGELAAGNAAALFSAMSQLLVFDGNEGFLAVAVGRICAAAAVAGVVRLHRAGRMQPYAWFGALYTGQLLVWNYPPDPRFALPVFPLLIAGAWTEFRQLGSSLEAAWKRNRRGDRVAAAAIGGAVAGFAVLAVQGSLHGTLLALPAVYRAHAAQTGASAAPLPPGALVLSYEDPVVYLRTGRRGYSLRIPPGLQRRGDPVAIEAHLAQLPALARRHGLTHVVTGPSDYHLDSPEISLPIYRRQVKALGLPGAE